MSSLSSIPDPFLEIRCTTVLGDHTAYTLCAGYEGDEWRAKKLAAHIFAWLPQVALDQTRRDTFDTGNWHERVELAAAHIYRTKKTLSRGEIGEILLHIACVQQFNTLPVLCKLVLKTSHNDTVKGFDAVHVVYTGDQIEFWLGESKFYKNPTAAINDALNSIRNHLLPTFLDTEKAMIYGHIPADFPKADEIRKFFHRNTSSDELIKRSVVPVLICYESKSVASSKKLTAEYSEALTKEIATLHNEFISKGLDIKITIQLIFIPMHLKTVLISHFDKMLEAFA
ncbi:HamA C-terminal domain-containing protein [Gemmobacter fulva]|uniref:HamA C-terminal domain-containing protein n=1 Tax=Gemmobacter fulvus TaxID=2840474 RepID=UPI0021B12281|nr:DUF1837 domain-containing protein [Gemmobacter fulvus]